LEARSTRAVESSRAAKNLKRCNTWFKWVEWLFKRLYGLLSGGLRRWFEVGRRIRRGKTARCVSGMVTELDDSGAFV
jgi:hypothetical protein